MGAAQVYLPSPRPAGPMTASTFDSAGVRLAYDDEGSGDPVVLVHGFASSRRDNWHDTGLFDALVDAGRRVLALDVRGHGESEKPHDPAAYDPAALAADVVRLLDHRSVERADLVGYSMGGRIALTLLLDHPERFGDAVVAGMGSHAFEGDEGSSAIADALATDDPGSLDDYARRFRRFAESRGNDLGALATLQRAPRRDVSPDEFGAVDNRVLVLIGADDDVVGDPGPLADALPNATLVRVPGEDHLTTVDTAAFETALVDFLGRTGA